MSRDTFDRFRKPERGRFGDDESRVTGASDLVDLDDLRVMDDSPQRDAIAVANPKGGKWIWLPKSQCEFVSARIGYVNVTLPRWLAKEKGLI